MIQIRFKLLAVFFIAVLHVGLIPNLTLAANIVVKTEPPRTVVLTEEEKLLEATVNLYCRIKVGNKKISSTGTGVMIDPRGIILTNAHVAQYFLLNGEDSKLKADCSVRTGSPAEDTYDAKVLYISNNWLSANAAKSNDKSIKNTGEHDFALLYVTNTKVDPLPKIYPAFPIQAAQHVQRGAEVRVAGYPSIGLNFKEIRSKLKLLSATTTVTNLQTFQATTTDTIGLSRTKFAGSGVSGGPAVVASALVGIMTLRSNSENDEGSSLRVLTTSYIDRAITKETGSSLLTLLKGDVAARAAMTRETISAEALSAIEKTLRILR